MKVTSMAMVDLRQMVRKNPAHRAAAWTEIKYRNEQRQAFERENGVRPRTPKATVWVPPNLEVK